jgi:hypothetical protein
MAFQIAERYDEFEDCPFGPALGYAETAEGDIVSLTSPTAAARSFNPSGQVRRGSAIASPFAWAAAATDGRTMVGYDAAPALLLSPLPRADRLIARERER